MIGDAGLPIPKGVERIDLGWRQGDPAYLDVLEEILKYIEANYTEPLTLADIASFSNISKHHLSREFKKYVGNGLKKHISKIRIKYSLNDLTTTDIPLIDIAINHGLNDERSYINAFKDIFGITPSKYRKDFMINKKVNDNVL